ncbi:MAG: glycosyltransferase family 4 protein [Verrucomicrobiaceae bacterium]|nr:glycosyltransferase family 4 protein [Verrucomicrobiaceae bacterium]
MKPSLLIICHTYAVPEHAKKLASLARFFDLTCATVMPRFLGAQYGASIPPRDPASCSWIHYELPAVGRTPFTTAAMLAGLSPLIRSRSWDYVLVENEPWSLVKWQTLLACRLPGASVQHYGEFTWENVPRPGLKGIILSWVYRLTSLWADFWVCGNQAAARLVMHHGMPFQRVIVCPQLGVDSGSFHPVTKDERHALRASFDLPAESFVTGFAGRLVAEKGVLDLLGAADALHASDNPDSTRLHLAFMGTGPLLEHLHEASKARPWLHLLPPLPHDQVQHFLQCLDLLCVGSKPVNHKGEVWEEQFGHILIEAIACGALSIGSTSGAIPEVLGDEALLFPPGDVPAISRLLLRSLADPAWHQRKQQEARSRLARLYTHDAVTEQLASALLRLPGLPCS